MKMDRKVNMSVFCKTAKYFKTQVFWTKLLSINSVHAPPPLPPPPRYIPCMGTRCFCGIYMHLNTLPKYIPLLGNCAVIIVSCSLYAHTHALILN